MSNELSSPLRTRATLLGLLLVVGFAGCGKKNSGADVAAAEAPADDSILVGTEVAEVRTIAETVNGLGRCESVPERIASLTPAVEGRVLDILVPLGESLKKGQPVIQLDPRIAEATLAEKKAARDELEAALAVLQAAPRAEELKGQELAVDQAKLALDKAKTALERLRPLVARKEISEAQMYEAELAVTQADVQQKTAEAQLVALNLAPRPEAVEEAKRKIATADAAMTTAEAQLKLHTISSPIDGVLDSMSCRLGQTVSAGSPIGEIVDARQVHVLVWLQARDAARVHSGQTARITANGAPQHKDTQAAESHADDAALTGQVIFVGHVADPQTGNLPVRILVENATNRLTLGQTVSAAITVNEKADVLAVPVTALFDAGEGITLNLVRDGKSVRTRPELGLRDKHWVEIIDTDLGDKLKPGELVIVEGGYNLPEGNKVKTQSAPQSAADGSAR